MQDCLHTPDERPLPVLAIDRVMGRGVEKSAATDGRAWEVELPLLSESQPRAHAEIVRRVRVCAFRDRHGAWRPKFADYTSVRTYLCYLADLAGVTL